MYSYKNLLAITLNERSESYTIEEIFKRFSSPHELLQASEQELMEIKGIGKAKTRQILSALQLAKMINMPRQAPTIIRIPQDVYDLLRGEMEYLQHELFKVIFLNTKNHIIAVETLSQGSLNASIVHPREVFRAAIKRSSASIVCAHNHPSGQPDPSPEDIQLTHRLVEVGELIGITVLDHIIIGHQRFISLKELGYM
ncbi:DNA repair protein RadC [Paenibacillus sp. GP183]|uniref:RadC family protein n=1 Tax=Paenibacillus sp. GP183 TaxID=1882751 RepID=UPI000B81D53C|nr:DNA repair protein RadC [Paenibacillus sp. GP183]